MTTSDHSDPTAIPIDFDPTVRRMRGVAVHGHKAFDVAYISTITTDLCQGGCTNGLVLPPYIEHVVSLYPWEQYTVEHELKSHLSVKMYDSLVGPDRDQVIGIARWVNTCRRSGITLVHCQAGLNRSGLISAMALMLDGYPARDAIDLLRSTRGEAVLCNPVFEQWLLGAQIDDRA